jgi:HD-like signal output (HDOD) protein
MRSTNLFLLAGLGVLVVIVLALGLSAWSTGRSHAVPASTDAPTAGVARVASTDEPIAAMPDCRELLYRLHAVAFEDAAPAGDAATGSVTGHAEVTAAADAILSRIETQPRYTPRRPQLLPQLMRTVHDPDASGRDIAAIIAQDPALAGNLLRIASSAFYRVQSEPVESIERAVAMVGTDGIRRIIAAALVQPVISDGGGVFGRFPTIIWEHTLVAATAAADHAKLVERDDAFAAQLVALLQGLGSIIVVQVVRDQYAGRPELVPDAAIAGALLDRWAVSTARRVAESWELSDRIGMALADQQRAVAAGEMSPLGRSLHIGQQAGAASMLCRYDRMDDAEASRVVASLDSNADAMETIWRRIRPRPGLSGVRADEGSCLTRIGVAGGR